MNKDQLKKRLQTLPFFKGGIDLKYKFHMQKCVSLLNGALWSMVAEIFSKKVFDYVSYTNKMLKRYEKQFDYYNSLRI